MHQAAAAAAAAARAIKATGAIVRLQPADFLALLGRQEDPMVVQSARSFFHPHWRYLTSYKGFIFFTKSAEPLPLPGRVELLDAQRLWLPD